MSPRYAWHGREFSERYFYIGLVLFFTLIRCFWLYTVYTIAPDQATQMNVAFNLMEGRGIVIGHVPGDVGVYSPYNWFPPGISFLLIPFQLLTGNIFLSEYILKCLISLMEGVLVVKVVGYHLKGFFEKALIVLLFAFYIGHMDRSGVSDMFCGVAGLWLMWIAYQRMITGVSLGRQTILAMAIVMPCMTLVRYSALPIIALPMVLFVFLGVFQNKWLLERREWVAIFLCTSLAMVSLIWSLKFIVDGHGVVASVSSTIDSDSEGGVLIKRLSHLTRIDPFWLHFGRRVDMASKMVYKIVRGDSLIDAYRFWQFSSSVLFLTLLFLILRKSTLNRPLGFVLLLSSTIHVVFLALLTLFRGPDTPVKYGIDGLIWTYMEEARYYNHLTFAFSLVLLIATWKQLRLAFWILSALFVYNTVRTMVVSKSDMRYLSLTFNKMYSGTHEDVSGEISRNRKAYYIWTLILGRGQLSSSSHPDSKQ